MPSSVTGALWVNMWPWGHLIPTVVCQHCSCPSGAHPAAFSLSQCYLVSSVVLNTRCMAIFITTRSCTLTSLRWLYQIASVSSVKGLKVKEIWPVLREVNVNITDLNIVQNVKYSFFILNVETISSNFLITSRFTGKYLRLSSWSQFFCSVPKLSLLSAHMLVSTLKCLIFTDIFVSLENKWICFSSLSSSCLQGARLAGRDSRRSNGTDTRKLCGVFIVQVWKKAQTGPNDFFLD